MHFPSWFRFSNEVSRQSSSWVRWRRKDQSAYQTNRLGRHDRLGLTRLEQRCVLAAPIATTDTDTLAEDTNTTVDVLFNDTFVGTPTNLTMVTPASNGVASVNDNGTPGFFNDDRIDYQPSPDFAGTDTFRYEVTTPDGTAQADVELTITPVNDAPVLGPLSDINVNEDVPATSIAGFASATPGGGADELSQSLTFSVIGNTNPGLFSNGPTVLTPGGTLVFQPVADASGTATITVVATDDGVGALSSLPSTFDIVVNPVNDPPVAVSDDVTMFEDDVVTIDVLSNDTDVDDAPSDLSLDSVTLLSVTGLTGPGSGTATIVGNQLVFDASTDFEELNIGDVALVRFEYTMSDDSGASSTAIVRIRVRGRNDRTEIISVTSPHVVNEGESLSVVNLVEIRDVDAKTPHQYIINWGDGSPEQSGLFDQDSPPAEFPFLGSIDVSHTYADNGTYVGLVQVIDEQGVREDVSFVVRVDNVAPEVAPIGNQAIQEGQLLAIANIGTFVDPGFDNPVHPLGASQETFAFEVDWGDGSSTDGGVATIDIGGGPGQPTIGSFDGSHIYADNGLYTVTLRVVDDDGGQGSASFSVDVANADPTLVVSADRSVDEGELLIISHVGIVTDPGFDNPAGGTSEVFDYSIDWGDGSSADAGGAIIDQTGGPNQLTRATFHGSHIYADDGTYTVAVTATDDDGGTDQRTFLVEVANIEPTLSVSGDSFVDEGASLNLTRMGTISDPGFNNPLALGGATFETFTYSIDWGDGTSLDMGSAAVDQVGSPGVPTMASFDGAHTYADNGSYTVTVVATDDDGGADTKTFMVTVLNVDPALTLSGDQTIDEGSLLSLTDLGLIVDPGFDNPLAPGGATSETFTYSIDWGDGTSLDTGSAAIDQVGSTGVPTMASFDGTHTYADNGSYTVTVVATDDDGGADTKTFTVSVLNVDPALTLSGDQTINEGSLLNLTDLGLIVDPGFDNPLAPGGATFETFTYSIDWGDGASVDMGSATIDRTGSEGMSTEASFDGSHTYADNGVYSVAVVINDDDGGMASQTFEVTVDNVDPILTLVTDQMIDEGSLLSLPDLGLIVDPGFNNPLAPSGATFETFTYSIDWGDGTSLDMGSATIDQAGSPGVPTTASFDGAHTYADNGSYTVTVVATDDDGGTDTRTFTVNVLNVDPALAFVGDQTIDEGSLLNLPDLGLIVDPGFDNPLAPGGATFETFTYSIDWGDGTSLDMGSAAIDQVGSPGVPTMASFDGAHTYADNGSYTVTVVATDDDGGADTKTFTVNVLNVDPALTLSDDQTIDEGSLLSLTDLGLIVDPGFDNPLAPGGATFETFTYSIDWGDGTSLDTGNATMDQVGSPGVPTVASFDGAHTYADNGSYTVTVVATDDDGGTDTKTFTVSVLNVDPALTLVGNQTINEGSLLSLTDLGLIVDPGFDNPLAPGGATFETFTYSIDWGDGASVDIGSATIDRAGSAGVSTEASFDGSHTYADNGVYSVAVVINDDDGGMASQTFEVTVNNVDPILTLVTDQMIDEGSLLSLTNLGVISDPGFDNPLALGGATFETFTYSIDWGDGMSLDMGSATIDQAGSPGVPTLATIGGSHTYADNGVYTATLVVADDDGGMASQAFEVTVNNVEPVLTLVSDQMIDEGSPLSLTDLSLIVDPGFDNPLAPGGATFETFTYSIDWGDGTTLDMGSAAIDQVGSPGVPTMASFDGAHTYADNGSYTVTVVATDDDGGADSKTFTVIVLNVDPALVVVGDQLLNEGELLSLVDLGTISDPGFDNPLGPGGATHETFTYSIDWGDSTSLDMGSATIDQIGSLGVPTGASFDGSHVYADDGAYTVTVLVADDDGGIGATTFLVDVANVDPTLVTDVGDQTVDEGELLSLTDLGMISDPGFDNPLAPGGATFETFTYSIDWGDGSSADTGSATIDQVGSLGVSTLASFDSSHVYADNGVYPVSFSVMDDDGGMTQAEAFTVTVDNVAPVLNVPPGQMANEGQLLTFTDLGAFSDPGFDNPLNPGGATEESFTFSIDWGDGSPADVGAATIDQPGAPGQSTIGSFDLAHAYADDGDYTVSVMVTDDDGGTASENFDIVINNVVPSLLGTSGIETVEEGRVFTLPELGIRVQDPGFDDPNNGTVETFSPTYTIDWGDGTPIETGDVLNRVPGSVGIPTTAELEAISHFYPDNATYVVRVTLQDDDDGQLDETLAITVTNVAPTLTVVADQAIDEGSLLVLPDIGMLTDPGFDDPSRMTMETFTFEVDWGDGNPVDLGVVTRDGLGSPGVLTSGSFDAAHTFADNGIFEVKVKVTDDDGGATTEEFRVTVNNVAPTVTVFATTDVESSGMVTVEGTFMDPGIDNPLDPKGATTEEFEVIVLWSNGHSDTLHLQDVGPFKFSHRYGAPPNPDSPASPIIIAAIVVDDDNSSDAEIMELRELRELAGTDPELSVVNFEASVASFLADAGLDEVPAGSVAFDEASVPGEGVAGVAVVFVANEIDRIAMEEEVRIFLADLLVSQSTDSVTSQQQLVTPPDDQVTDELRVFFRVVDEALDREGDDEFEIPKSALDNVPKYFTERDVPFPNGRYRVYLEESGSQRARFVLEINVYKGRLVPANFRGGDLTDDQAALDHGGETNPINQANRQFSPVNDQFFDPLARENLPEAHHLDHNDVQTEPTSDYHGEPHWGQDGAVETQLSERGGIQLDFANDSVLPVDWRSRVRVHNATWASGGLAMLATSLNWHQRLRTALGTDAASKQPDQSDD